MPGDGTCDPACVKIIIDTGGRIAAAADMYADTVGPKHPDYPAARYLANTARADAKALVAGIRSGAIDGEAKDRAHAWSELNCHRAAAIEGWCDYYAHPSRRDDLFAWATQDRLTTTSIAGGEYRGRYELVNDTEDIRLKAETEIPKAPRAEPSSK